MSEEEWQICNNEWRTWLGSIHDDLWELKKDDLPHYVIDELAKVTNVVNKLLTDMNKASWTNREVDEAYTLVAGYVTQSNVERQRRRDTDLANHKVMIEKAAEKRIIDGLREASQDVATARRRADEAEARVETAIAGHKALLDNEQIDWAMNQKVEFDKAVKEEVERRLMGGTVSPTPGRTKRPVIIG